MISYKEYKKLFQQEEDGSFVNLIIPKSVEGDELNLIGKTSKRFHTWRDCKNEKVFG